MFILKAKIQIVSLYNIPKLCYIHVESGSGRCVVSMTATKVSLGNQVFLKKLGSCPIYENLAELGNGQETKWIIRRDEENKGWHFIQESKSGQYLGAPNKQKLITDGIYLV